MQISDLHAVNPYEGFPIIDYRYQPRVEWGSEDSNFDRLIKAVRPELIIEVGSWYGGSAIHMSQLCQVNRVEAKVLCIDNFNGAPEMWINQADESRYGSMMFRHGRPDFYMQFMANVILMGEQERIIPFSVDSQGAAVVLTAKGIQADLVFIDGDHTYDAVLADLRAYWPLVKPGGCLFGDDWETWGEVKEAVEHFCTFDWLTKYRGNSTEETLKVEYQARQWEIWKPL